MIFILEIYVDSEGREWFPATELAEMLGYKNPQKAIRDHCTEKGCTIRSVLTNGGKQSKKYINEDHWYRLTTRCKIEGAEEFESWIFEEEEWILEKDVATVLGYKNTKVRGYWG